MNWMGGGCGINSWRGIMVAAIVSVISGCAAGVSPPSAVTIAADDTAEAVAVSDYRIGVDDVVQVSVWRNPDLSVTVPVRPDGKISVPLVGDVEAGGLKPEEVAAAVSKKLAVYLRDPQVALIVTELKSDEFLSRVRVTGAVRTPLSFRYRRGVTVLDAVLEAGGVNEFAAADRTKVYRRRAAETRVIPVYLGRILQHGELDTNIELQPGDVVAVPERLF